MSGKTDPKVDLHCPFCLPPQRILSVAVRISFQAFGFVCLAMFNDYGADTNYNGYSHAMCLIVQGGK